MRTAPIPGPRIDRAPVLICVLLGLLAGGCASGGAHPAARPADTSATEEPAAGDREVGEILVVLPPRSQRQWMEVSRNLARLHNLHRVAAWEMESLGEYCIVYRVPSYTTPAQMAERVSRDQRVSLAQPNQRFRVQGAAREAAEVPAAGGDPYQDLQHASRTLRLPEAHRTSTGRGVTVAVVDTGVDLHHPDLRDRVAGVGDFVNQGEQTFTTDVHGTAVAGVIAANAGNDIGIVGVAPEATVLALKACWHDPPGSRTAVCDSYTLAQALDSAIGSAARVATLSLTGPDDPLLARLLRRALERGILPVAAVDEGLPDGGFPARLDGVLAPWPALPENGALPGTGKPSARPGPADALHAPAVEILTSTPGGSYDFFSGASFAAAHAAGAAALVLQLRPEATPAEVTALLRRTAHDDSPSLLDAAAAVAAADARTR